MTLSALRVANPALVTPLHSLFAPSIRDDPYYRGRLLKKPWEPQRVPLRHRHPLRMLASISLLIFIFFSSEQWPPATRATHIRPVGSHPPWPRRRFLPLRASSIGLNLTEETALNALLNAQLKGNVSPGFVLFFLSSLSRMDLSCVVATCLLLLSLATGVLVLLQPSTRSPRLPPSPPLTPFSTGGSWIELETDFVLAE